MLLTKVLEELENTKFPKLKSRKNISDVKVTAFAMGEIGIYDSRMRGPSVYNAKFPELYTLLQDFIKESHPEFEYTTIQVNKNVLCEPHVDKNNVGVSYGISLGDFTGGNLVIEGIPYDIHDIWAEFDGRLGHWVDEFEGTRYSLIYFTHTFKPPCASLRKFKVTKDGMYERDVLIQSYKKN
jgi:hypothetical protein